jgi:hypothetical protein
MNVCPHEECYFWGKKGQRIAAGNFSNREEALQHLRPLEEEGCWIFERCNREFPDGTDDYFEPLQVEEKSIGL